ncbi:hypothetical protein V2K54_04550 [Pseudomonas alliivorans]|nr:hypothetical protein [Pseudomonas alliivorans]MEE5131408.1 hypothetical protein [Pseudomonas alliivorans]MEE5172961.1 hypothetical protein [Pseudomonas alliivorans]
MIRKGIITLGLSLLVVASAQAAPRILEGGSLFCASEEAFDEQMKYLANDVKEFVEGCSVTNQDYRVIILDLNLFSASKVKVIDKGLTIWVAHESLSK